MSGWNLVVGLIVVFGDKGGQAPRISCLSPSESDSSRLRGKNCLERICLGKYSHSWERSWRERCQSMDLVVELV